MHSIYLANPDEKEMHFYFFPKLTQLVTKFERTFQSSS